MKHLLIFLLFPLSLTAQQHDSLDGGPVNIIDGIIIPEFVICDYDSIAQLHPHSELVITDSSACSYTFQPGKKRYLEIILRRKNCKASDMSNYEKWIIDLSGMDESGKLQLSAANTVFLYWNQWIRPAVELHNDGLLTLGTEQVSLELHAYMNADRLYFPQRRLVVPLKD